MRIGKDLLGKPIYSIIDGRFLGKVKDLFLDADLIQMKGIFLGNEGLLRRQMKLIPQTAIAVFGLDAVLVQGESALANSKEWPDAQQWVLRSAMIGRAVNTGGGTKVGIVGDLLFDVEGMLAAISLAKVFVAGPVADQRLIPAAALLERGKGMTPITIDLASAESLLAAQSTKQ